MKNNKIRKYLLLISLFILLISLNYIFAGSSITGGITLKQTLGARPLGMGEAYISLADDINSIFFNPAGLTKISVTEISATYMNNIADTFYTFVGAAIPINRLQTNLDIGMSTLGISLFVLSGGKMEVNYPDGSTETICPQTDYLGIVSYSYQLLHNLSIGGNIKFLSSTLAQQVSAYTFALDIGAIYNRLLFDELSTGVVVKNMGLPLKFEKESDNLPLQGSIGLTYNLICDKSNKFIFSIDVSKDLDTPLHLNCGTEYNYKVSKKETFSLRLGYKFGYELDGLTGGLGVQSDMYSLDYAFNLKSTLPTNHIFSVTIYLGKIPEKEID